MTAKIQLRRDTSRGWLDNNTETNKLAYGEAGVEYVYDDNNELQAIKLKIGDGVNIWSQLPYITDFIDYTDLLNLPKLNNVTITGDKTSSDYGIASDTDVVHTTGNETIGGVKTFSASPLVPTVASSDNSTNAASTSYVKTNISNLETTVNTKITNLQTSLTALANTETTHDNNSLHKTGDESFAGTKTMTGSMVVSTIKASYADNEIAPYKYITQNIITNPVGTIIAYLGNGTPNGYLLCNGANTYSRSTYANLYNVIGTKFGYSSSSTFGVPNLSQRFLEGTIYDDWGGYNEAGLPTHTHYLKVNGSVLDTGGDVLRESNYLGSGTANSKSRRNGESSYNVLNNTIVGDPISTNSIYGSSSTVQPKSMKVRFFIKY